MKEDKVTYKKNRFKLKKSALLPEIMHPIDLGELEAKKHGEMLLYGIVPSNGSRKWD
jgi:hypothetical protein